MSLKCIFAAPALLLLLDLTLSAQAQSPAILHTFTSTPDGASPLGIVWTNGLIYGSAAAGGTSGYGTVFTYNPSTGVYTSIYNFTDASNNGGAPNGVLVTANAIYGTLQSGGTNSGGMIYALSTNGAVFTPLYAFAAYSGDGLIPDGALVLGGTTLYGNTSAGGSVGAAADGTIFKINTDGSGYSLLHSFTNSPDGAEPEGALALSGNTLYGTTFEGGAAGGGCIYSINTNNSNYTILHSFTNNSLDLAFPEVGPTLIGGVLYGTCVSGGTNRVGGLYAISTNGSGYQVIYDFSARIGTSSSNTDGAIPKAALTASGNYLLGTASSAGLESGGTTFLINTNGSGFATIANFTDQSASGWDPLAGAMRIGNSVWGTTYSGDGTATYGSLYSVAMPAIIQQPQSLTVTNTMPATFTAAAADDRSFSYQWYFKTNTLLTGQNTSVLTLASATNNNEGGYTVVVTDNLGSVTSSPALLTVIVAGVGPTITNQPQNYAAVVNGTASFTNGASGTPPLAYQWYFNTNTLLNGQTGPILAISSVSATQQGYYTVVVTNSYGSTTSTAAFLAVNTNVKPSIAQQPQNYTVTNGYNAYFTNVANGTAPLAYQWYFNTNTAIAGGTNPVLVVPFALTNQAGYYSVIVTNVAGSATSAPASLTVIPTLPIIFVQPQAASTTNGQPFSFTVTAAGQNPLHYQWYTNAILAADALAGKTNSALTIAIATNWMAGNYYVVITNQLGKATSSPAPLTVLSKPVIMQQPQNAVVTNGDPATFTVGAAGAGVLSYQWYFHTNTLVTGATNISLIFTNAITNLAGYYSVRVTNMFGAVTSSYALLTISNRPNLLSFEFDPASGTASFAYADIARGTNRLWVTTNLASAGAWRAIATNVMATNGLWFVTDPGAAKTNSARFYRFSTP